MRDRRLYHGCWVVEVSGDLYEKLMGRAIARCVEAPPADKSVAPATSPEGTVIERSCRACDSKRLIRLALAMETRQCTLCGSEATDDAGPYSVPRLAQESMPRLAVV